MRERRQDHETANHIAEAVRLKRAFDFNTGARFLRMRGVADTVASDALAGQYERRSNVEPPLLTDRV